MAAYTNMFTKGTKVVHPKHGVCEYISTPLCRNDGRDVARIKLQDGRVVGVLLVELKPLESGEPAAESQQ